MFPKPFFPKPFAHHSSKLDIIRHFTPNWFTVTMGTGVLALLLGPARGGEFIWLANIALFTLFTLVYAARWVLFPKEAILIFRHASMAMFLGAIPMGFATIVNGLAAFTQHYALAQDLWVIDAVLSVATGLGVPFAMFTLQSHRLEQMTAIWLLPIVACEVAAASAGGLAGHINGAIGLEVAGYALWALSVPLALSVLAILFLRLALHKLPGAEMGVSSWLAVGPLGTGALALLLLGKAAPASGLPFAEVAQGLGLIGGLALWAYGAWWLMIAALMTLTHAARKLPFNMGWWGFTFPFGVFILATKALAAQTSLSFFSYAGTGMTVIFALLWLMVAARTLAGAYRGNLFNAPCLAHLQAAE